MSALVVGLAPVGSKGFTRVRPEDFTEGHGDCVLWLAAHKVYPGDARRRGEEGRVGIRFTADRSVSVLSVELVHSSGSAILDGASRTMLRGARSPAFPQAMSGDRATVTVQIQYTLEP